MTARGFEERTTRISIDSIIPTRHLPRFIQTSPKYKTILASIKEIGIIEPLAVYREKATAGSSTQFLLLDGHLRLEALRELGILEAVCLISTDDDGFTYNRQINRISVIQEHKMIVQAIERGVEPERIARTLSIDVNRIRESTRILNGISAEVVELLKDRLVSRGIFSVLRKMRPIRQIEAAEMMISANRLTVPYVKMIFAASRPDALVRSERSPKRHEVSAEDISRMEREMETLHRDYSSIESSLGETMLALVVAKGYVTRLLRNSAVNSYLDRHHKELLRELTGVMKAVTSDARTPARE
jgi:hypothetical protein